MLFFLTLCLRGMHANTPSVVTLDSNVQKINWHATAAVKPQYLHDRNTFKFIRAVISSFYYTHKKETTKD